MAKRLIMILFLTIALSACGNDAVQISGLEPDDDGSASVESPAPEEIVAENSASASGLVPTLQNILENDSMEGSVQFFIYLLENHSHSAEFLNDVLPEPRGFPPDRFAHILHVFERDGMPETDIEVLEWAPVDTLYMFGVPEILNRYGHVLYLYMIEVNIKDGGENKGLPEGQATWLAAFMEDGSHFIEFVLPYEDARLRLEARARFPEIMEHISRADFFLRVAPPFSIPDNMPNDAIEHIVFYLLWHDPDPVYEGDGSRTGADGTVYHGRFVSQERLDAIAKELLNLGHIDGRNTFNYIEEFGEYFLQLGGFGGPNYFDVLKIEADGDTITVYVDCCAFVTDFLFGSTYRQVRRYTYIDGFLQAMEVVSADDFVSIILTGEDG